LVDRRSDIRSCCAAWLRAGGGKRGRSGHSRADDELDKGIQRRRCESDCGAVCRRRDPASAGAPGAKGRAAIQAFIAKDIADSKQAGAVFNVDPKTDVGVSGDLGWESGTYTVTVKGVTVESGKFLSVSRKKDGKWLYIRDTWNADAAAAPAAPPPAPAKK
jgi:hypothetical protein